MNYITQYKRISKRAKWLRIRSVSAILAGHQTIGLRAVKGHAY